jgi:hypothetical protein
MRVAIVALILAVGAIVILGLSDALAPSGFGNFIGGPGALLLCIPISLALFSFLAHQQSEQHKLKKPEMPELRDSSLAQPKE